MMVLLVAPELVAVSAVMAAGCRALLDDMGNHLGVGSALEVCSVDPEVWPVMSRTGARRGMTNLSSSTFFASDSCAFMPRHKRKKNPQGSTSDTQTNLTTIQQLQQATHRLKEALSTEKTTKTNDFMKQVDEIQEILIDTKNLVCDVLTPCSLPEVTISRNLNFLMYQMMIY